MNNLVGKIMDYESGQLGARETIELFSALIADGTVWELQGSYGRMAASLIENGWLLPDGTINPAALSELEVL